MQSTRQRIMDYLKINHSASAIEMSRTFRMTSANLRHHLQLLVEQGLIKIAKKVSTQSRGRPTSVFMLTPRSSLSGLSILSSALIKQLLGSRDSAARRKRLQQVANHIAPKPVDSSKPLTTKLGETVDRLNDLHYRSHWEAHSDGARIILGQCPYAEIIGEYPELCQLDSLAIKNLLEKSVAQESKIAYKPDGPHKCVFIVSK